MTARIVNLRQFRKRKAREARRKEADANAVEHGRTGAERELTGKLADLDTRRLDGHRRDDPGDNDD